jgi:hypothetical protein
MRACKPVQISSARCFPTLDKERRHRTRQVDGEAREARLDAHGVSAAPVGIARAVADRAQALND